MSDVEQTPRFIKALRKEPVDRPPVWFMRQAGRSLPEYRKVREGTDFLGLCKTPELACEVTLQPIARFGYDTAIIFCDILMVPEAMGLELSFGKGEGPKFANPVRDQAGVDALIANFDPIEKTGFLADAIKLAVAELPHEVPLIGFAGAPFTVACYMVEGAGSKHFLEIKSMMYQAPEVFTQLLDKVVDNTITYLRMQVEAGCRVLQLFDTWAGELSADDLQRFAVGPTKRIFDAVADLGVPLIYFPRGCGTMLDIVRQAGADCYGLDWRVSLTRAWDELGDVAIQGNLDPAALLGPPETIAAKTNAILDEVAGKAGHVFNLGHGVLPQTPIESIQTVLDTIRARGNPAKSAEQPS